MTQFEPASGRENPPRKKETLQRKSARTRAVAERLARAYPAITVPLRHRSPFQLLVATILSAQCTDEAVNRVTPELFRCYPDAVALSRAPTGEIEEIIRRLGLFRAKAKSLKACACQLVNEFGSNVPSTMEELIRLSGVGRKTANVILGYAFDAPGIVVDTHCKRVSRRLGLTRKEDPEKIEKELRRLLPPEDWTAFSHRLIVHGRRICHARKPHCGDCVLYELCPSRDQSISAVSQKLRA